MVDVEKPKYLIYPWDMSTTGAWDSNSGLQMLRNGTPEDLAEIINEAGTNVDVAYVTAMAEYFSHGNPRKAAEVTRALIKLQPSIEQLVKEKFDSWGARDLLKTKLDLLAGSPSEFPKGSVDYVL